jgi:AraC-like DNA-binding protein
VSRVLSIANCPVGRVCLLDKDRPTAPHAHLEPHAMVLIDGASQRYRVGGSTVVLDRQHAVLVNSQELHANEGEPLGPCTVLMLYLSPDWAAGRAPGTRLFDAPSVSVARDLYDTALRLTGAMQRSREIDDDEVQGLLAQLAQRLCDAGGLDAAEQPLQAKQNDFRIRRAISLMHASIDEPLSVAEICGRVGLSRSRFFELFAACTGLSPKHYANMLRLDVATQRLVGAQDRIGDISHQCGFGAQSHFSKFFVEQQGFTPREFRRAAAPQDAALR